MKDLHKSSTDDWQRRPPTEIIPGCRGMNVFDIAWGKWHSTCAAVNNNLALLFYTLTLASTCHLFTVNLSRYYLQHYVYNAKKYSVFKF